MSCSGTAITGAATWGGFQSLFQLSVAINVAFAVLKDLVGDAPERDAAESHNLGERANEVKAHDLAAKLFRLESAFKTHASHAERGFSRFVGPVCLCIALLSLFLLCLSSFCYGGSIHWSLQAASILQFFPFLYGAWLILRLFRTYSANLRPELRRLESELKQAERNFQQSKGEEGE